MRAGAIARYRKSPLPLREMFVAQHARVNTAAKLLAPEGQENASAVLNDPAISPRRAARLVKQLSREPGHEAYFLGEARLDVVQAYWQEFGGQVVADIRGENLLRRYSGMAIFKESLDFLPVDQRDDILAGEVELPAEIQLSPSHYLDTAHLMTGLIIQLKSLWVMELVDRFMQLAAERDYPFWQIVEGWARYHLEFFPAQNPMVRDPYGDGMVEQRVFADHDKRGHSYETLRALLGQPISEDLLQRVQAMKYCTKPYGEAATYREEETWRGGGGAVQRMVAVEEVPTRMKDLVDWVNSPKAQALHAFKRAAVFYMMYDAIHPFPGSTKHVARFMTAKICAENGLFPLLIDFMTMTMCFLRMTPQERGDLAFLPRDFGLGPTLPSASVFAEAGDVDRFVFHYLCSYYTSLPIYFGDFMSEEMTDVLRQIRHILVSEADEAALRNF